MIVVNHPTVTFFSNLLRKHQKIEAFFLDCLSYAVCWVYNQNVEWKLAKLEFFWWSTKLKTRWYQLHTSSDIDEGNSLQAFFSKDIIATTVLFSFRASATKSNTVLHTKQVSGLLTGFPEIKKIIYWLNELNLYITCNSSTGKHLSWYIIVFNATFNNISVISWRSVLLVEETGVAWENHRHVASHWQNLSHNVVSNTPRHERDSNSQL